MVRTAFLFPGQGSQSVGMGKALYEASSKARWVFETFDRLLGYDLTRLCFDGPEEELKRTRHTQPAILAVSIAALEVFRERQPDLTPVLAAGHSLGEYGALYAAGVVDLETVIPLVQRRAELMDEASEGAMSAVLGLAETQVEKAVLRVKHENKGAITIANYNTGDQYVISGSPAAVETATAVLKEEGAKRVLPLPVGGAFHSPLMDPAAAAFKHFLQGFRFQDAAFPVITNVDAQLTHRGEAFREKLADQINSSVRWTHTMQRMAVEEHVEAIIEFGPGKVLSGMVRKMYPDVRTYNVADVASLEETLEKFA